MTPYAIYTPIRTPMGRFGGHYKNHAPMKLAAALIEAIPAKAGIEADEITEVFLGQCRQAGHGPNPARSAALWGGLPQTVPATTVNMACPSGMQAVRLAHAMAQNRKSVMLVGGMDSMSTIPYLLKGCRFDPFKMGNKVLEDGWSDSIDPVIEMGMGETAEQIVKEYNLSREEMDAYALQSQKRAGEAQARGWHAREIQPCLELENDETVRANTSAEKLAQLRPVFDKQGAITAGNACCMADAAAVMLLAPSNRFPNQPAFAIRDEVAVAVDPAWMGLGPAKAVIALMQRNGLNRSDIGVLEINEAFAAQILANLRDLDWDPADVNRWGGAIALGHPTGMSGARLLVTLAHQLTHTDQQLGIAAICGAGGVSNGLLLERIR